MAEKLLYSMGEVAEMFDVRPSLLRHWESQFPILRPRRNKKGNRLFTPQDVENLKVIYHLVKERGMTLDGAKKALKQQRADKGGGVARDAELMERLQHIRSLLVEVREDLKTDADGIIADDFPTAEPTVELAAEESAAAPSRRRKAVVKIEPAESAEPEEEASEKSTAPRKPRRKKDEAENKELFAFYEQSLF